MDEIFGYFPPVKNPPSKWKDLMRWVRQNRPLLVYRSKRFKLFSDPRETKADFMARLAQVAWEERDQQVEKRINPVCSAGIAFSSSCFPRYRSGCCTRTCSRRSRKGISYES